MTEFTDEQARERFDSERGNDPSGWVPVVVGRGLLTLEARCKALEQKLDVLKGKLTLAYDERDAAEARCKALEARLAEAVRALTRIAEQGCIVIPENRATPDIYDRFSDLVSWAAAALAAVDGKKE